MRASYGGGIARYVRNPEEALDIADANGYDSFTLQWEDMRGKIKTGHYEQRNGVWVTFGGVTSEVKPVNRRGMMAREGETARRAKTSR